MKSSEFPTSGQSLPEADLPFEGLRGWLLQSNAGQVLFNESDTGTVIKCVSPAHRARRPYP
jgi:hypothetical protein